MTFPTCDSFWSEHVGLHLAEKSLVPGSDNGDDDDDYDDDDDDDDDDDYGDDDGTT